MFMTKSNLHTHTCFSDGSDIPGKYSDEALKQGFDVLGFSDHGPVPFANTFAIENGKLQDYVDSVLLLKEKYSPQKHSLKILLGLEIDYIPGVSEPFETFRKDFPFDYLIGSVHLVKNEESGKLWFIDGPDISIYDAGLKEVFENDIQWAVTSYYRQVQSMVTNYKPEIIGHLDKIKMYNRDRFFSENDSWYLKLVDETLDLIKDSGSVIEVNTRGLYKKRATSFFPGEQILMKIRKLEIPVMLASDAHKPQELSMGLDDALNVLKTLGFKKIVALHPDGWVDMPVV